MLLAPEDNGPESFLEGGHPDAVGMLSLERDPVTEPVAKMTPQCESFQMSRALLWSLSWKMAPDLKASRTSQMHLAMLR